MRLSFWVAGFSAIAGLVGCSPAKVVHDKAYFASRDAERASTLAACQNNPGEEAGDANCVNAVAAQADVDRKKAWSVTPPPSRQTNPGKL